MAKFSGKGSMKGVNLIAVSYDSAVNEKTGEQGFDFMVDYRDERAGKQADSHLYSKSTTYTDKSTGEQRKGYDNKIWLKPSQGQALQEAMGENFQPHLNQAGERIGWELAIKADLMPNPRGSGLMPNSKTFQASDFGVHEKMLEEHFVQSKAVAGAERAAKAAEKEAAKEAPSFGKAPEQAQEQQKQDDSPSFG